MNRTVLNRTLLNTSVLCQSRLNQSGLAPLRGIRYEMELRDDIERQGCTNESMAENPVLKDLSGNGHDATCYNFSWSDMSGVGGYNVNFRSYGSASSSSSATTDKITIYPLAVNELENKMTQLTRSYDSVGGNTLSFQVRVTNFPTGCRIIYYYRNSQGTEKQFQITEDGVYTLPESYNTIEGTGYSTGFRFDIPGNLDESYTGELTIEQMPLYPGALISDGVDDYCYVEGLPILTKEKGYTVVAKREHLNFAQNDSYAFASKCPTSQGDDGAFMFEGKSSITSVIARSFGSREEFSNSNLPDVSWMTSQSYNGNSIIVGDASDYDKMVLFRHNTTDDSFYGQFALYSLLLFSRDLTAEEIEWVKTNLITV